MKFKITGMDCADEVAALKRELGPLVGGEDRLAFDLLKGKMTVQAGAPSTAESIIEAVGRTGMNARPWDESGESDPSGERLGALRAMLTSASGVFLATGFSVHAWLSGSLSAAMGSEGLGLAHGVPMAARVLYALGILTGSWLILPKALYAAKRLRPDMNLLMIVAVLGAVGIGEWFEASTVAFLFSVALLLESWSIGRARRAIAALMELSPSTAHLKLDDGSLRETPADDVPVGAVFVVKPGDKIPLDGRVVAGESAVNQAPITGESMPVTKAPGGDVYAGTINGDGALEVRSTKAAGQTTLAHIIRLVGEAQSKRSPSEQWVEKFARIYTPAVMLLSLAVLLVPTLLFGSLWTPWLYRSLVLLVIGCPCALVISTPVTVVAALAAAAKNGVLLKGGGFVETPARLKAVAFDKTGTLTKGKPVVVEVAALGGHSEPELLEIVAAMEANSGHPLARSIMAYAGQKGIRPAAASGFEIIQGKGATATVRGERYWLGSHRYLEERKQETKEVHEKLDTMTSSGRSVVIVGDEKHVCGLIALADTVRPEARRTLEALRAEGIEHLVMLTGDNKGTADEIAKELGLDEVYAELLPKDKVSAIEKLVARYGAVAMIGDGVNDAPALAASTMAVAMGAAGSDAAIETADVALMSDDLSKLPWLMRHSRRSLRIIRQNIGLSLLTKGAFVLLTFLGYASLWSAIAADMGVSLIVIFNALRLLADSGQDH
ncbi:MAG: heavy metal translocating P-type ATPase [Elusimicrobiota bacterium]|nr:heavy metal translocating P-type ATPase [Elusimicrobiota bacterium]